MPLYLSYLLQPLDIVCFALLKRIYSDSISQLVRNRVQYISKETFLPAFESAFEKTFIEKNIRIGFRDAELVPLDSEMVISKLNIRLYTPTPRPRSACKYQAKISRNAKKINTQSKFIQKSI